MAYSTTSDQSAHNELSLLQNRLHDAVLQAPVRAIAAANLPGQEIPTDHIFEMTCRMPPAILPVDFSAKRKAQVSDYAVT